VNVTLILQKKKQRVTVPGMVGWTLLETAEHHNLPAFGTACAAGAPWDYNTFGEGPNSVEDHVVVSKDYYEVTGPPFDQELDLLLTHEGPNYQETSRLAACIKLTKEMDGMTVLVPETNVDFTKYV